jgi:hypothetical protein
MQIDMETINKTLDELKEKLFEDYSVIVEFRDFDKLLEKVYNQALDAVYYVNKGYFYGIDIETTFWVKDMSFRIDVQKHLEGKKSTKILVTHSWWHIYAHGQIVVYLKIKRGCPTHKSLFYFYSIEDFLSKKGIKLQEFGSWFRFAYPERADIEVTYLNLL